MEWFNGEFDKASRFLAPSHPYFLIFLIQASSMKTHLVQLMELVETGGGFKAVEWI